MCKKETERVYICVCPSRARRRTRSLSLRHLSGTAYLGLDRIKSESKAKSKILGSNAPCAIVELPECGSVEEVLYVELEPDPRSVSPSDAWMHTRYICT
jgi:hypothetical protein